MTMRDVAWRLTACRYHIFVLMFVCRQQWCVTGQMSIVVIKASSVAMTDVMFMHMYILVVPFLSGATPYLLCSLH